MRRAVCLGVILLGCAAPSKPRAHPSAAREPARAQTADTPRPSGAVPSSAVASSATSPPSAEGAATPAPFRSGGGGARAVAGSSGLVVSAEPLATHAGVSVLEAGGNAVDAAVATAAALAVTHPSAGNLGGGGFMLVRPPGGPTLALDFRETAPSSLTRPEFEHMIAEQGRGPVAPGVPGSVAGLCAAERRLGKLPLARTLGPAVALARDGVVLASEQAALLKKHWPALRLDPAARAVFGDGRGAPLRAGARLQQPALAALLERIGREGEAAFYAGPVAASLVQATAGHVSLADLAGYRAVFREPLGVHYRGLELETMPPPSAGGLVLAGTLVALESLGPAAAEENAAWLHRLLELSQRAQALRRFEVLDPDAQSEPERLALRSHFLDPSVLMSVPIDPEHATPSARVHPLFADALREAEHTTHVSVVDREGMVVALTTTLSASFGAKIMVPAAGVLLGNAVASFSSMGDNQPAPGRRTTSSMAPTLILERGVPLYVLGTPGGDTIPSTLALLVTRLVDRHQPLDEAVDAPRCHHGFVPDVVRYEAARPLPRATLDGLAKQGHVLLRSWASQGDASVIALDPVTRRAYGYADPREGPGLALAAANSVR